MKTIPKLAAAFALFASSQAFAIIGVGAHYVTNLGSLKSADESFALEQLPGKEVRLKRAEASTLQGLGFKLWLDFLPLVDIEGTLNFAAVRYVPRLDLGIEGIDPIYLEYAPEAPYSMYLEKASPIYGLLSGDVSVTYPFDLKIIRLYAGLGISYIASIPVIDKKFIENMNMDWANFLNGSEEREQEIKDAVSKALTKTDYRSGFGGHIIVGSRFKVPIIPIAAYANAKYYFGGDVDPKFNQGIVFELGGGFAI